MNGNVSILFVQFVRGVMRCKILPNWLHWVKFYGSSGAQRWRNAFTYWPSGEITFGRPEESGESGPVSWPRRIRRRELMELKRYGILLYALNQFFCSRPANMGKDSFKVVTSFVCCYWTMHTWYFARINFNLECQFCANASFSLLLILPGPDQVETGVTSF